MDVTNKYAVLRVVPDERRGERVNIGLIVLKDRSIDVRLVGSMSKVSAVDGTIDIAQIFSLPQMIKDWLSSTRGADAKYKMLKSSGLVSVSDLGWFKTRDNEEYESTLARLMDKLVVPRLAPPKPSLGSTKITSHLRARFKVSGILGRVHADISKHLVVANYPLAADEDLFADFVLKNGVYRVTETADFRAESGSGGDKRRIASEAAVKLDRALKVFKRKNVIRYAVVGTPKGGDATASVKLLGNYVDEMFNIDSSLDMADYMQRMLVAAKHSLELTNA